MSDSRWIEIVNDFQAAKKYFEAAQKLYEKGTSTDDEDEEFTFALAFMHAILTGHTALESGMERIMDLVGEDVPTGKNWHADIVKRMSQPLEGKRPALLSQELAVEVNETRAFRHVAAHTYDDFNWAKAKRPVAAAQVIAKTLLDTYVGFRQQLDPTGGEDGSGGGASGGPPAKPKLG